MQSTTVVTCGPRTRVDPAVTAMPARAGVAPARSRSSRPHPRKISIVLVLTPVALGNGEVPGWRSTTSVRTPWWARLVAVTSPAGPAPTTMTS